MDFIGTLRERLSTWRAVLGTLLALSTIGLLAIVLLPVGHQLGLIVSWFYRMGTRFGIPHRFGPRWYEFGLNVVLFLLPLFLAALLWPSAKPSLWGALGFFASLCIEGIQFLFLPRSPDITDIVANTAGAWIGAVLAHALGTRIGWFPISAPASPHAISSPAAPLPGNRPSRREVMRRIHHRGSAHLTEAAEELRRIREERAQ